MVKLTFTKFDLEDIFPCAYAYVHVYDGSEINEDDVIQKNCGRTIPDVAYTSTHEMFIEYRTQDQGFGTGIEATVEFIDVNGN